jgi:hypothetical protein
MERLCAGSCLRLSGDQAVTLGYYHECHEASLRTAPNE